MESLMRQTRVRFSGVGNDNKEETGSIRDRRIPPQKTQSFKEDKKRPQSWLRRQLLRQTSNDFDYSNDGEEYPAAVAAAAFAINLLEELSIADQKKKREGSDTTLSRIKSKTEDTTSTVPEAGKISRRFSGELPMTNFETPEKAVPVSLATDEKIPERGVGLAPSIKKTPTFTDKPWNSTASRKPESAIIPTPEPPPAKQFAFPPTDFRRQSSTRPGMVEETEADAWEKAEMAKIKERYDKLKTTILDWESKKKTKAKRRRDRTESEIERRRAKALKQYYREVEEIDKISAGARAQAEENRRKEEWKVKEKANKIRMTGKIPQSCLCF